MILWGRELTVEEAYRLGGEAAVAITELLRAGAVTGLIRTDADADEDMDAGTGADKTSVPVRVHALSASAASAFLPLRTSPARRDLVEACKAIELTNEKVYGPYLLDKKKRYAGLKWTMNEETGEFVAKMDMKGIDAVRRDRAKFVRNTCSEVLRALLYDKSVDKARAALAAQLDAIVEGRTPVTAFVLSKSVRGSYKGGAENLPQVQAWRRMQARGDDDIPPVGARVPYLVTAPRDGSIGGAKARIKMYARAEHTAYVLRNGLPLDVTYYIEQLIKPVSKLVHHVHMQGVPELFARALARASAGPGAALARNVRAHPCRRPPCFCFCFWRCSCSCSCRGSCSLFRRNVAASSCNARA